MAERRGIYIAEHALMDVTTPATGQQLLIFDATTGKLALKRPDGSIRYVLDSELYDTNNDGKVNAADAADAVTWSGVTGKPGTFPSSQNVLINGCFQVWQRGLSYSPADGGYTAADQWYGLRQSNSITTARIDGATQRCAMRLTQSNTSAQRMGIAQVIEGGNCRHLRGEHVTLSALIRSSGSVNIRYAILSWTGTEDSPTKDVVASWTSSTYTAGNFFLGSSFVVEGVGVAGVSEDVWTSLILTLDAPLSSSMTNLIVFFWTESAVSQNETLDIEGVQLEEGTVATPLVVPDPSHELTRCQRYLWTFTGSGGTHMHPLMVAGSSSGTGMATFVFPIIMRAPPTLAGTGSVSNWQVYYGGAGYDCDQITLQNATPQMAMIYFRCGNTLGYISYCILDAKTNRTPYIWMSAEL